MVPECIELAQKLLDIGRKYLSKLFECYEASETGRADIAALLLPLENAVMAELEGQWEELYLKQMQEAAKQLADNDLKSARKGVCVSLCRELSSV